MAIANAANDRIDVQFDDDMVMTDLLDPSNLALEHPVGVAVPLVRRNLSYDDTSRTLRIQLDDPVNAVNLQHGLGWQLVLSGVRDLGGNSLGGSVTVGGTVTGDGTAPSVLAVTQNTAVDPLGSTVDIAFDEVIDPADVGQIGNYVATVAGGGGSQFAVWAAPVGAGDVIRVTFAIPVTPGQDSIEVRNLADLAGNALASIPGLAISPDDAVAPTVVVVAVTTVPGRLNDAITVAFDEPILPAAAMDLVNYTLESPAGTPVPLGAGTQIHYDSLARTASLVLASQSAPVDLKTGAGFLLTIQNVTDVAGNALQNGSLTGTVTGDMTPPQVLTPGGTVQKTSVNLLGTTVDIAFDEAVDPSRAAVTGNYLPNGGQFPLWATVIGLGDVVRITFDQPVPAGGTITLQNMADLAGNTMAVTPVTVVSEESIPPALLSATATAVANRQNDLVVVQFTEPVMPGDATDPSNFSIEAPQGTPIPLDAFTSVLYDVVTLQTRISLTSPAVSQNLPYNALCKVTVNNVRDVSGNVIQAVSNNTLTTVVGDGQKPTAVSATPVVGSPKILEVTFSEELDPASVATATWTFSQPLQLVSSGAVSLNSDGRTVRIVALFSHGVGQTVDCQGIRDLAGNTIDPVDPAIVIQ
jgi:hypothetical protein